VLHQRFGSRVSGSERRRRAAEHLERAREAIPFDIFDAPPTLGPPSASVAIVGAGFAGCAAAYTAKLLGLNVTLYDRLGRAGGRVEFSDSIVPGRILEKGAELIGLNHPLWIAFANEAGLGLSVVTPEDKQGGGQLHSPLILNGRSYSPSEQKRLYDEMNKVFDSWVEQSKVVTDPWNPWTTPNAPLLHSRNLTQKIPDGTPDDVLHAIKTEFELNNTVPASEQSWLAILAQIQAGGGQGFFEDTEIFRCSAGNQRLADWLVRDLTIVGQAVRSIDVSTGVELLLSSGQTVGPFDYVIVATSVAIWPYIKVDGRPFPFLSVKHGPAIKYLAPIGKRFWIPQSLAPDGLSDVLGMIWEGTDNQADTAGFDLTVFAGGTAASNAIKGGGSDPYFNPLVSALYPGFKTSGGHFVNWPSNPAIQTGYSCPAPGEVVSKQLSYVTPYKDRLFVAGEHTSPAWFGFMEGALESGISAACRVATAAALSGSLFSEEETHS
jgi:monoamine oxidase